MVKMRVVAPAVLALALSGGACSSPSGNGTEGRVEEALRQAQVEGVDVNYDRDTKAVHLSGEVNSEEQKQRAQQVAETAVGTSGVVVNDLKVEGTEGSGAAETPDDRLKTRLNDAIQAHPELSEQLIDFYVNNGAVTVTGEVQSAAQKAEVDRIVKDTPGVEDYANELRVARSKGQGGARQR